jgi:hypothetical protein
MAELSKPEQLIKITLLLRDIPDELEKHFCSTHPRCEKFCGPEHDKTKCALFACSEEEIKKTIFGLDAAGRMLGIISDE